MFTVSGFPSPVVAGTTGSFTVTAADAYGNKITSYQGTVHFSSDDAIAGLPANYTFLAGDDGSQSFSVTLKTAGSRTVQVKDTIQTAVAFTSTQTATVNAAAAAPQPV